MTTTTTKVKNTDAIYNQSIAFEAMPFAACLKDASGTTLCANDQYHKLIETFENTNNETQLINLTSNTIASELDQRAIITNLQGQPFLVRCSLANKDDHPQTLLSFQILDTKGELEHALASSQVALSAYLEHAQEMIVRVDLKQPLDSRWDHKKQAKHYIDSSFIGDCNNLFAEFYGYSDRSKIIGKRPPSIEYESDFLFDMVSELVQQNFQPQNLRVIEELSGKTHWSEYSCHGVWDGPILLSVWSTKRDITLLVTQEKEIQERDERHRNLISNSSNGIARLYLETPLDTHVSIEEQAHYLARNLKIAEYNQAWGAQYNLSNTEDVIDRYYNSIDDIQEIEANFRKFITQGYSFKHQHQSVQVASGEYKTFRYSLTAIINDDILSGVWIFKEDFTQLREKEKQLQSSEERHRLYFDKNFTASLRSTLKKPMPTTGLTLAEQLAWFDEHLCFSDANQAFCKARGWQSIEEFKGRPYNEVVANSENSVELNSNFLSNGFKLDKSNWSTHLPDGSVVFYRAEMMPIIKNGYLIELWTSYQDTTDTHQYIKTVEHQASHDSLTDLPNRSYLHKHLDNHIPSASLGFPLVLMFLDLDLFKEVNDALGHHAGDELLRQLGPRISEVIKQLGHEALVARLGGDEFAICCKLDSLKTAEKIADAILSKIKEAFYVDGIAVHIGCSIGIAACPQDAYSSADLMRHADIAMYRAKTSKLGFTQYSSDIDNQSSLRLGLMSDLRYAIENNEQLEIFYQPKIELHSGKVCGCEALIRWNHPIQGLIGPSEFILIAETTELIHPLTQWVVDRALDDCKQWWTEKSPITISVNFSTRNLMNPKIIEHVRCALNKHELPSRALEIEITESALMQNPTQALNLLKQFRELGVAVAIDDFGTGYSSMNYLKNLPISTLKIDYSFLVDMMSNHADKVIVDSVINLGHNLGLSVVAEGIENQNVQDYLSQSDCDIGQGFHIGHPMPIEKFLDWIKINSEALHQENFQ